MAAGRFPKGVSGNPSGRPKDPAAVEFRARARKDAAKGAWARMIALSKSDDEMVAHRACAFIIERAYGKPGVEDLTLLRKEVSAETLAAVAKLAALPIQDRMAVHVSAIRADTIEQDTPEAHMNALAAEKTAADVLRVDGNNPPADGDDAGLEYKVTSVPPRRADP